MSILLDALKKSETQRQLGETPTLQTPAYEDDPAAGRGQPWIPVAMMALTLGVITWIGLKQYSESDIILINDGEMTAMPDAVVESTPHNEPESTRPRQPAKTPVMDYQVEASDTASQPGPVSEKENQPVPEADRSVAVSQRAVQKADRAQESAQASDPGDDSLPPPPEEELVNPYQSEVLSYWQIPQALRDSMPEMRISVLVYAERPENRFLLIDGERLREKDELISGLVLEEIRNDRAIFTYRNYRFHVKS